MAYVKHESSFQKPTMYAGYGKCIYCLKIQDESFSQEHIIPKSINGSIIIKKGSCRQCADVTKVFEQTFMRVNVGHHRIRTKLYTRKPKERPGELPISFRTELGVIERLVPISDHPYILPCMNLQRTSTFYRGIEAKSYLPKFLRLKSFNLPGPSMEDNFIRINYDDKSFYQTVAKIAHSFAVALFGLYSFEPFLLDLILRGVISNGPHFVGKIPEGRFGPQRKCLHWIGCYVQRLHGERVVVVKIQLFSNIIDILTNTGTPIYHIVVGKAIEQDEYYEMALGRPKKPGTLIPALIE